MQVKHIQNFYDIILTVQDKFFGSEICLVMGSGFKPDERRFKLSLVGSIPTHFRHFFNKNFPIDNKEISTGIFADYFSRITL